MNKTFIKQDTYYDNLHKYFQGNEQLFLKLQQLNQKKEEIKELKRKKGDLPKPIVITVSGTPRAGKTTCIDNLYEFFKKCNFKTFRLEEPAGIIYGTLKNKDEKKKLLEDRVGFVHKQYEIGKEYIDNNLKGNEIILCDRGIIDTIIWYDMYYKLGMIKPNDYKQFLSKLCEGENYYNFFYALYVEPFDAMLRDYLNSLSIEPRSTMNQDNVERYNKSLIDILPKLKEKLDFMKIIDTTNLEKMDASIISANEILDKVKVLYRG